MKALVMVIDSLGIGEAKDAASYGDEGANTILRICQEVPGPLWPSLTRLGLGNAASLLNCNLPGCPPVPTPLASYGVAQERSAGKDTTTGHWELAGLVLERPFALFPKGFPSFPEKLLASFSQRTGVPGILGNKAASGTAIIEELGEEHMRTRYPICYTSADSVFQIACHTEVYSLDALYHFCEVARDECDAYHVGRVIARPFSGLPGHFKRTKDRHDYSIALPGKTILDHLQERGIETIGVGKIGSIFNEQGLTTSYHDAGNEACLARTTSLLKTKKNETCFIFVNLVDTDMIYGHRRDVQGYKGAIDRIDKTLPRLMTELEEDDLLVLCGDHGCDPGFRGTDHTREDVPLLVYRKGKEAVSLGIRHSFADLAQSLASYFGISSLEEGTSIFNDSLA